MNLAKSIANGVLCSALMSLRARREMRMPIELMRFPCVELEGMTICASNAEARTLLGEDPSGRPLVALLDEGARRVWRRESARRMGGQAEYLGETGLRCRRGQVRVRMLLLRGRRRSTLVLSSDADAAACAAGESAKSGTGVLESDALADIAHEMRTPLTVIRSAASLMRERPETGAQYISGIERNCERLQRIVNEIVALNSAHSSREPMRERLALPRFVEEQLGALRPQAQCQGVELSMYNGAGEVELHTDARLLEHVLLNLIGNALKFTPAGGNISVRMERVSGGISLTVADTGCGIAPGELKRIFERGCTGDPGRGAGIGLTLARRCAALLGGELTAFSDGVSGSRFTLTLPMDAEDDLAGETRQGNDD